MWRVGLPGVRLAIISPSLRNFAPQVTLSRWLWACWSERQTGSVKPSVFLKRQGGPENKKGETNGFALVEHWHQDSGFMGMPGSLKPTFLCEPSQNGFSPDWPQRQRATPFFLAGIGFP